MKNTDMNENDGTRALWESRIPQVKRIKKSTLVLCMAASAGIIATMAWFFSTFLPSRADTASLSRIVATSVLDAVVITAAVLYAIKYRNDVYRYEHSDGTCDAVLTGWKTIEHRDRDTTTTDYRYIRKYQYSVDGIVYDICGSETEPRMTGKTGDTVKVRYDTMNPGTAFIDRPKPTVLILLLFFTILITAVLATSL